MFKTQQQEETLNMNWHKLLMSCIVSGLLILQGDASKTVKKRGVMDNFSDGLKVAGQMFGINTAADVANLVAKAFSNNNNNNNNHNGQRNKPDLFSLLQNKPKLTPSPGSSSTDQSNGHQETEANQPHENEEKETGSVNFGTSNLIASMLRLVGFDASKLGALAINALIMIASAIGNTLMGTTTGQPLKNTYGKFKNAGQSEETANVETGPEEKYSPNAHQPRAAEHDVTTIEWFLQNSSGRMKHILKEATHADLADKLTDMITNYETERGQAACIKMLVCKSSPFIWGMQRSIRKHIDGRAREEDFGDNTNESLLNVRSFFTHLPSAEEYREYSKKCEKIYAAQCNTTDLFDREY